jgi:hypothetical protein
MWNNKDIQKDLLILSAKYQQIGYNLTLEQCYDIWTIYSDYCHATWLDINDIEKSLKFIDNIKGDKLK